MAEQVQGWDDDFREFLSGVFALVQPGECPGATLKYLCGLLASIERRSGWILAEHAGDATPDAMQGWLVSRCFDRNKVRDKVRFALVSIGDGAGVLMADEIGFIKKGRSSAGMQKQYSGTTGKIDNCQIGVFLADHTAKGVDRP